MAAKKGHGRGEEGFTIIEMLVAVGLSILLIGVVTMAFQVAARTIEVVQRKLDIYEAARGVMQEMSMAIKPAALNFRGEYFIIKSVAWQDKDPRTPEDATKVGDQLFPKMEVLVVPQMDATRYDASRRECDCLSYIQSTIGRSDGGGATMPYAAASPYSSGYKLERFHHNALFRSSWDLNTNCLDDVLGMNIKPFGMYANMPYETLYGADTDGDGKDEAFTYQYFECEEFELRPGRDYSGTSVNARSGRGRADIASMDFNVSFWHDGVRRFIDPPDYTMVAISPLPRAIKIAVSIWDYDGRDYETFCRIIWLPAGVGGTQPHGGADVPSYGPGAVPWLEATDPASLTYADADVDWAAPSAVRGRPDDPGSTRSAYFNRYKQVVGAVDWDYATNWNLVNYYGNKPSTW